MSIKKTRWRPDTCECDIEYEWDSAVSAETRVHTVSKINSKCDAHKALNQIDDVFTTVLDENQRKNKLHGAILDNVSSAIEEIPNPGGTPTKKIKAGKEFNWSFDKDRNLVVDLEGFTASEKSQVTSLANSLFGSKVIIN